MSKTYLEALSCLEAVYKAGGNMEVAKEFIRCRFRLSLHELHRLMTIADFYKELQEL